MYHVSAQSLLLDGLQSVDSITNFIYLFIYLIELAVKQVKEYDTCFSWDRKSEVVPCCRLVHIMWNGEFTSIAKLHSYPWKEGKKKQRKFQNKVSSR